MTTSFYSYLISHFFASRTKWPRLRSATGSEFIKGRERKCGCAAFPFPPLKAELKYTERSRGET